MQGRRFQFVRLVVLASLPGLLAEPAQAQRGAGQGKVRGGERSSESVRAPAGRGPGVHPGPEKGLGRGLGGWPLLPLHWIERLRQMSPEEQERFLNNNERFRSLPAERQARIRERLRQWNSLTPEQQSAIRERGEIWRQMSPEQRRRVRQEILPKWRQLDREGRQAILQRLRVLRGLSEVERAARLTDENFLTGLSAHELELLRELSSLRVGPPPSPSEQAQESHPPR